MKRSMQRIKPPYLVRILSKKVRYLQTKTGFVDSSRKFHYVFPKRYPLGIRLDDNTLRVIQYDCDDDDDEISPQRGDRLCALGGETVKNHKDVHDIIEKHLKGPDRDVPIVGTFVVAVSVYSVRLVSGQPLGITMRNQGLVVRKLLKEASETIREVVRVGDVCMGLNGFMLTTSNQLQEALRRVSSSFETHFDLTFGRHRKILDCRKVVVKREEKEENLEKQDQEQEVQYLREETEMTLREERLRNEKEKVRVEKKIRQRRAPPPPPPPTPESVLENHRTISRNILESLLKNSNDDDKSEFLPENNDSSKTESPTPPVINRDQAMKDLRNRIEMANDVKSEIDKFCAIVEYLIEPHIEILDTKWTQNVKGSVLFNIHVKFGISRKWKVKHPYKAFKRLSKSVKSSLPSVEHSDLDASAKSLCSWMRRVCKKHIKNEKLLRFLLLDENVGIGSLVSMDQDKDKEVMLDEFPVGINEFFDFSVGTNENAKRSSWQAGHLAMEALARSSQSCRLETFRECLVEIIRYVFLMFEGEDRGLMGYLRAKFTGEILSLSLFSLSLSSSSSFLLLLLLPHTRTNTHTQKT